MRCAALLLLVGLAHAAEIGGGATLLRGERECLPCHAGVVEQWRASAHRFSSLDNPYYAASFDVMLADRGPVEAAFCAGCHDPALVANGLLSARIDKTSPGARAGVGCLVCHSTTGTDLRGNGGYHADIGPVPRGEAHSARVKPAGLGTPRFCAGCHKVGLLETVTAAHWQRGQDEYDDWYDSAWAGRGVDVVLRPPEKRECLDCHMPRVASPKPDRGAKDGMIRDHRFLAANTALPHLRGDAAQLEATRAFLRGVIDVDVRAPSPDAIDVVLRNHKVGHRFPGGTQDSNLVWLEYTALDGAGRALTTAEWLLRVQAVDADAKPLSRRDVHRQAGVVYDTSLPPNAPRAVRFAVPAGTARVRARVLYQKFSKDYAQFACASLKGEARARCLEPPVVEVAVAESPVPVPPPDDWRRLVAWGLALAAGLPEHASEAAGPLQEARRLAPDRPEPVLALARRALVQGRTDDVLTLLGDLDSAAAWSLRLDALLNAYRHGPALQAAERLATLAPDDRHALARLARARALGGDFAGALEATDRLLAIDPEHPAAWLHRFLSLRALARPVTDAEAAWLRHRRHDEDDYALRQRFRALFPERAAQTFPLGAAR
jgi:tetratricopeptide (TPR) repeat protein